MRKIGVYIHIPFCKSKCYYCDFYSVVGCEDKISYYINTLKKEIIFYSSLYKNILIDSIFLGGGTPSILDYRYIFDILDCLHKNFKFSKNVEVSIESNPGTLSYIKLKEYKKMGINRLSIGLQAWQDNLLRAMGRIHKRKDFLKNLRYAQKAGFKNINVDLIFGLPNQTMSNWVETLVNVAKLGITHISCYSLKIEERTLWGKKYYDKSLNLPEDVEEREMYHYAISYLEKEGFTHYEISNFSKDNYLCKHNIVYWRCGEYLGLGVAAHGYIDGIRYENKTDIDWYMQSFPKEGTFRSNEQKIGKTEAIKEYMIMGLRLIKGISLKEFEDKFGISPYDIYKNEMKKLIQTGLLKENNNTISLTMLGLDFANRVFVEFI